MTRASARDVPARVPRGRGRERRRARRRRASRRPAGSARWRRDRRGARPRAGAGHRGGRARTRSRARTRPGSSRPPRTGCTRPRSTSRRPRATSWSRCCGRWTTIAARLTAGLPAGPLGPTGGPYDAPPDDTGEALGAAAGGPHDHDRLRALAVRRTRRTRPADRFGLADRLPEALVALPHFPGDDLDPVRSDGDLIVQACADDPQVAMHAVRNLTRVAVRHGARPLVPARLRPDLVHVDRAGHAAQPHGLQGRHANVKAEETGRLEDTSGSSRATAATPSAWLAGGSYMVARRIRMHIETWDRTSLREQEAIFGRTKGEGAPLSGGTEFTEPDFAAAGRTARR